METFIAVLILILILGAAALYIFKAKKRGQACIGCPHCNACSGSCGTRK